MLCNVLRKVFFGMIKLTSNTVHVRVIAMWLLMVCLFIVWLTDQTPDVETSYHADPCGHALYALDESLKAVEQTCKRPNQHG